ncbi:MAG TPA: hypothetical protein VFP91_15580 [Vicinamibacterales bacterium]|nr:hypothetical protein [Vicinamibacterales bacterium]
MPAIVACAALIAVSLIEAPVVRAAGLPDEAAGIDGIAAALMSVYDLYDVVALGEMHERRIDSDLRIALVRHPDFAKKVRTIVVEFATTMEQTTLDRYIRGENVPRAQLDRVRPKQPGSLTSEDPIYLDFFAAVREVNSKLPADARIRVFGGEDNRNRDTAAVAILKEQVFQKHGKALVVYGAGHFWRQGGTGLVRMLDVNYPGRTFVVIPVGGHLPGETKNDYPTFDRALKTKVRPVMVPLQRSPFRDFTAEKFLDGTLVTMRRGRWVSIFAGSTLTLGQMADACVYLGRPQS